MDKKINWKNECEKIANGIADEVCRKFADNEIICLDTSRPVPAGPVYAQLSANMLNDEYNTVIITYSLVDREDIVLKKEEVYQVAAAEMDDILKHPDWQEIKDADDFRIFLRKNAEWAVGDRLQQIFSQVACADPDKYPKYKTHGHIAKPVSIEELEKMPLMKFPRQKH